VELDARIFARRPGERQERVRDALDARLGSLVAVCESVRRRHNVSAILRSCEAFGIHEVHLVTQGFEVSPGAARGGERWVRRRRFDQTHACFADLRARGFRIYVADLAPDAYTPETIPVDAPLALVFGSELRGVSANARAEADGVVCIPMRGLTASLNVSVSAAILLRAVADRRRAIVGPDLDPAEKVRFYDEWIEAEAAAERGRLARQAP
jgi:tRNA (guanosine-2'-O-)-methyltransferase